MYRVIYILTCILFIITCLCFHSYAKIDELAFEAEDADKIEPPMTIVKDDKDSGGKYIKSPQGRAGWAEYEIEIPNDDKYYMWGMVQEHSGVTDSFFITFDLEDRGADNDTNPNTWDLDAPENAWTWDRVSGRGEGGDPRVFELSKGIHSLRVWTREEETWLDCIFMSTDQNAQPVLASEFKGRARTSVPKNLMPMGKLAITWGRIRLSD